MVRFFKNLLFQLLHTFSHITQGFFRIFQNPSHRLTACGGASGVVIGCVFTLFVSYGLTRNCTSVFNSIISFRFVPIAFAAPKACPAPSADQIAAAGIKAAQKEEGMIVQAQRLNRPYNLRLIDWLFSRKKINQALPDFESATEYSVSHEIILLAHQIVRSEFGKAHVNDIDALVDAVLAESKMALIAARQDEPLVTFIPLVRQLVTIALEERDLPLYSDTVSDTPPVLSERTKRTPMMRVLDLIFNRSKYSPEQIGQITRIAQEIMNSKQKISLQNR